MMRALPAGALTSVLALVVAGPAIACDADARGRVVHKHQRRGPAPWVLGDSTMIYAAPIMGRYGMEADAQGCRQFAQGVAMIARRRRPLPDAVVLALGANGAVTRADIARARRVLGRRRFLVLVTPKNSSSTITAMRRAERAHPDRVLTLDWARHSAGRAGWFGGDNLHVTLTGARAYTRFVREGLDPFFGPPRRGWLLDLPYRRDADRVTPCGRTRSYGRTMDVFLTRGADELSCSYARKIMRGPRLHPRRRWRFYDWRTVGKGPWTDVLARRDRSVVVAAIAR